MRTAALIHSRKHTPDSKMDIFAWLSNIYRFKIYLCYVSYARRKTKGLKCIKQHKYIRCLVFAMIDIKGCLRTSTHISEIVWTYIVVYNRFRPDWFVGLFQVRFGLNPAFPHVSEVLLWFVIFPRSGDERTHMRFSLESRNHLHIKYWLLSNNKSVAHPLVIIYK